MIEVLIVVVIIGIISAIAIPAYSAYITRANQTDAISFLSEVAGEQQRYFSENNVYAGKMSELGYGTEDTQVSPEGHYTISINRPASGTTYTLTATPVAGGRQASDSECQAFTLDSTGLKANTGGTRNDCW